ncbi:hypothetical protein C8J57DRAFT_1214896 [Mycena rebaudengoi]|nr:hypothetical protein C8J57DRAFT_1214896 [Mycena rebaudengoi]
MRIFSFVKDTETFYDIIRASRAFYAIGSEEKVRSIYWKKAEDVEPRLASWKENPRRRLVKELNIRLPFFEDDDAQRRILTSLSIFPNLSSLTIRNGHIITRHLNTAVTSLPNLRRLMLQWTTLETTDLSAAPPTTPFAVKNLLLHEVLFVDPQGEALVKLDATSLAALNLSLLPLQLLNGLESLSISSVQPSVDVRQQASAIIPDTPNLVHLAVRGPPSLFSPLSFPTFTAPSLSTFYGPRRIAASIIPSATNITRVCLLNEITSEQALELIQSVQPLAMRDIEMTLKHWVAEVLYEIAHRFSRCKRIKIVYRYWGPSSDVLFDLGIHHLPRMPALETLLFHARPEDAEERAPRIHHFYGEYSDYFDAADKWAKDGKAGLRDVPPPPTDQESMEHLAIWTQYNPHLEVVSLGDRLWTRAFRGSGTGWTADGMTA